MEKPAMRTDSKRTPVSTMEANSSRASVRFCSGVSPASSSGVLASVSRSSGSTCPSPTEPGTSTSGSRIRFRDAVDSRSIRCSIVLPLTVPPPVLRVSAAASASAVSIVVVMPPILP